jgi:histidine triad (HIT) family protein
MMAGTTIFKSGMIGSLPFKKETPPVSYDNNNIFARILRGELPCIRVYEDENTLAFMDIMPQSEGHTLVIPKEAAATILDISPAMLATTIQTTQRISQAVKKVTNAPGLLIAQFNGAEAGQTVPHLHFHIIPRRGGEALRIHASEKADMTELQALAERIKAELN